MIFMPFWICFLLHLLPGASQRNYNNHCRNAYFFEYSTHEQDTVKVIVASFQSISQLACSQECLREEKCNYQICNIDTKKCELLQSVSQDDLKENEILLKKEFPHCNSLPSNVCAEKCKCVDTCGNKKYQCDCSGQGVFESCKQALKANNYTTNSYWIQPSPQQGAMQINCTRDQSTGESFAVFHHDTEKETKVDGYPDEAGAYKRTFKYTMDMDKIINFIKYSASCQQFTRARCQGLRFVTWKDTWISGRSGNRLKFWGGGPSDGVGCACGMNNTCLDNAYKCNCDNNDRAILTGDEGYVRVKSILPITSIAVGDTDHASEILFYTIGPLLCNM